MMQILMTELLFLSYDGLLCLGFRLTFAYFMQVWHAVSDDRKVLRKTYLETIVPPFAALLRRWRPLLSGIHEFTDSEGQSPLAVEDRPLAIDAPPLEVKSLPLL